MTNAQISENLLQVAAVYEIKNESTFRISAYRKAALFIKEYDIELSTFSDVKSLEKLPFIGNHLAQNIYELNTNGESKHFTAIIASVPSQTFILIKLRGVGPKTAYQIALYLKNNKLDTKPLVPTLNNLLDKGSLNTLEGFGEKKQQDILASLSDYEKGLVKKPLMRIDTAQKLSHALVSYLLQDKRIFNAIACGSIRRKKETVADIDIIVLTLNSTWFQRFLKGCELIKSISLEGNSKVSAMLHNGIIADFRICDKNAFASTLQYFTGSKFHNITLRKIALDKGYSLSEYGVKHIKTGKLTTFQTESALYNFVGLDYIEPELRENRGELDYARKYKLPKLVNISEIKGDLHIHSDFKYASSHDKGISTIEEILSKANERKYEYIALADHNPKQDSLLKIAKVLQMRNKWIEQKVYNYIKNKKCTIKKVFKCLEVDIKPSGELAIDRENFQFLDFVIISIHSAFNQSKEEMTNRILKGLAFPKVKILGHPSGRLVPDRSSIQADWDLIFRYCFENNIACEINSDPHRLDLPDELILKAKQIGVKFIINTDSHAKESMDYSTYGVYQARRGWCEKKDILNTKSLKEFEKWIKL